MFNLSYEEGDSDRRSKGRDRKAQIKETALSQISKEMTKPIKKVKNPKRKVLDSLLYVGKLDDPTVSKSDLVDFISGNSKNS